MYSTVVGWTVASLISLLFWPFLAIFTALNEGCRLFIASKLPKQYKLTPHCFGNFLWSEMFNSRMVIVALYSDQEIHLSKDKARFEKVFAKGRDGPYSDLKKTLVGKYGYGCLRDERTSFQISNHVRLFDSVQPQNGEYFTEAELSKRILPAYLSVNMDECRPQWEWLLFPTVRREQDGRFQSLRVFRWDHRYMDGAAAGLFMAESVFDQWEESHEPPYIYNPKITPPYRVWMFLSKAWGAFHLPLIIILSLIELWRKRGGMPAPPFATWNNRERKVFSTPHSLPVSQIRISEEEKSRRSYTFKSLLLSRLVPVLSSLWTNTLRPPNHKDNKKEEEEESVGVATFQALLPYTKGKVKNQFTIVETKVPLHPPKNGQRAILDFPIDLTFYFANVYTEWIGRLPIPLIQRLAAPAEATVALNSVPYLKKTGRICGSEITEIASWDILYTPVGVDFTVMGYGGKIFISAFSVEEVMSHAQLNETVQNFVSALTKS